MGNFLTFAIAAPYKAAMLSLLDMQQYPDCADITHKKSASLQKTIPVYEYTTQKRSPYSAIIYYNDIECYIKSILVPQILMLCCHRLLSEDEYLLTYQEMIDMSFLATQKRISRTQKHEKIVQVMRFLATIHCYASTESYSSHTIEPLFLFKEVSEGFQCSSPISQHMLTKKASLQYSMFHPTMSQTCNEKRHRFGWILACFLACHPGRMSFTNEEIARYLFGKYGALRAEQKKRYLLYYRDAILFYAQHHGVECECDGLHSFLKTGIMQRGLWKTFLQGRTRIKKLGG
jgi:hypothetical protein